jgi:hypothetical protein
MVRTAAQHSRIAAVYERAARDETLPSQARAAFAKKGSWFRMLAQIEAAKAAGALSATSAPTTNKRQTKSNVENENLARNSSGHGPAFTDRRGPRVGPVGFLTQDVLSRNRLADEAEPGNFGIEPVQSSLSGG